MNSDLYYEIICDDLKLKNFLEKLYNDKSNDNLNMDFNPNYIIKSLKINFSHSINRGWNFLRTEREIECRNCSLYSLLIIDYQSNFMFKMLKKYNLESIKGDFIQIYKYDEAKDSYSIYRYTFENFYPCHVLNINHPSLTNVIEEDKESFEIYNKVMSNLKLENDIKCRKFEVQYKSHLYGGCDILSENKYTEGYIGTLIDCTSNEILRKKDEILSSYDKFEKSNDERFSNCEEGSERYG